MLLPLLLMTAAATPVDAGIAWDLTAQQIASRCDAELAKAHATTQAIVADTQLGGLPALDMAVAAMQDALTAEKLLKDVSPDPALRDASAACADKLDAFQVELAADPGIYALALAFKKSAHAPVDLQLAKLYLEEGRLAGAGLNPESRDKVKALLSRLDMLESGFFRALGEDRSHMHVTAGEAQSLPPSFLASLKPAADGSYDVPVDMRSYQPFIRSEASGDARRRFDTVYYDRGGAANLQRLKDAVAVRRDIAQALGFKSWAALVLDTRMAKTPQRPEAMLEDVDARLLPKARAEIAVLAAMKKADGDVTPFAAWDYAYYEAKLERERYAVDDETVRRYFPADKSLPAMMHIYEHLFGLRFTELKGAKLWAPGVQEFAIQDSGDGHLLGWFFLDLVPRPEKSLRPANFTLRDGHLDPDGSYTLPISSVIGSGPAAAPGQPALFSYRDMLEMFHEFGHLMHGTLSTAPYATLYGSHVREDFVEAPSQMMENWMWQPAVLKQVSSEVDTGKPLPDELIRRLTVLEHAADGATWTRQCFFGLYDLAIHGDKPMDAGTAWDSFMSRYMALPPETGTSPPASFVPLMGGYDAGYYGYIWSRVYAEDMFGAFHGHLDDPTVGLRFRREVLGPGGSEEPELLVQRFLGRPVDTQAFYREVGLTAP
jgi:thimet oligopeptidase